MLKNVINLISLTFKSYLFKKNFDEKDRGRGKDGVTINDFAPETGRHFYSVFVTFGSLLVSFYSLLVIFSKFWLLATFYSLLVTSYFFLVVVTRYFLLKSFTKRISFEEVITAIIDLDCDLDFDFTGKI